MKQGMRWHIKQKSYYSGHDLLKSREAVMSHFCKVHNINLESAIKITPSEMLPVEDREEDCLKGIIFND